MSSHASPAPHANTSFASSTSTGPTAALQLPDPSTFDFLPPLHQLLSRLLSSPSLNSSGAGASGDALLQPYPNEQPLEIQNLQTAAGALKVKIQKARQAIKALPSIDRTVEDQEEEIAYLTERIEYLKGVLNRLGQHTSGPQDDGDTTMQG
ncbi:hypothetical protein M501DRAFT_1016643 [Patellaria atrata CBS 101060]|uniref:Mediator of RNA polymerase II transcription subunit 9 n=1 Tax=Patellaria atrata CBS 101060 TaxID=1346257 RepID=A0A9P4SB69_9PEZI|nr:hypothetical protein M501DRAFT_1016643 [Patellaria atrata CBS 101060]